MGERMDGWLPSSITRSSPFLSSIPDLKACASLAFFCLFLAIDMREA